MSADKRIYKLMYWSTRKTGDQQEPYGQQDFDMTDYPPGHAMEGTEMSRTYQRLYDDPTIYRLEIWRFFTGFDRDVPGRSRPKTKNHGPDI